MNTLLGMDANRRRQVFEQTAAKMNLATVAVEKDLQGILEKLGI